MCDGPCVKTMFIPAQVNSDAFGSWFIKVKMSNPADAKELLSAEEYEQTIK